MDKAGRIVVPKPLRDRLGLKPDTQLEVIEQPQGVLLKRLEQRPSMVKIDGLSVHQGSAEVGANWEAILEEVRDERIDAILKRNQVDIFFDTTVLVAASEQSHPHYARARPTLVRVAAGQDRGFMGQHSIVELFAALMRLAVQPRIHPIEAARIVTDNILPHFEIVSIGTEDYLEALNTMASGGWTGAKIYDALLLRCAARCTAERIYTFNLRDFGQLAPAGLREKICAP